MTGHQIVALAILAALALLALRILRRLRPRRRRPEAVIDGSNVMHWQDNAPKLDSVAAVLRLLERKGYRTAVIFDANAGYLLQGRYLHDHALGRRLGLPGNRVLVVPKGQQADPFLLTLARDSGAVVISNDRFRDRIADYPELSAPGRLVRGGWRDGKPWLDLPER